MFDLFPFLYLYYYIFRNDVTQNIYTNHTIYLFYNCIIGDKNHHHFVNLNCCFIQYEAEVMLRIALISRSECYHINKHLAMAYSEMVINNR